MSAAQGNNADTNPGNFANRPTEEVKAIASMGGKASHGGHEKVDEKVTDSLPGRNPDGTFAKSSESHPSRNADGTFTKGSEAAKEAGHKGGLHSHDNDGLAKKEEDGRNPDGTFKKGSDAAKDAGHKGGLATASES